LSVVLTAEPRPISPTTGVISPAGVLIRPGKVGRYAMTETTADGYEHCETVRRLTNNVDLLVKSHEPISVDVQEEYRDSGTIEVEDVEHVAFELVESDAGAADV